MASMLAHPSAPSSSHSCPSATDNFVPSLQASELHTSSNAELWDDIDLAESFLISSQFDEAVTLSSKILQTLRRMLVVGDDVKYKNDLNDMMESSGMVLIQALSEGGREDIILSHLETIFGHLSEVPPPIFFSGVCLQISAGLYLDAQASIECFLKNWVFSSIGEISCTYKPADKLSRQGFVVLKPEMYIDIAELYCIEVLAKGIGNINAALNWLENVKIPEDSKQDILRRLEELSSDEEKHGLNIYHNKMFRYQSGLDCDGPSIISELSDSDKYTIKKVSHSSSSFPLFSVINVVSEWLACGYSRYGSQWNGQLLSGISQRKILFTGAAVAFVVIALYKQKRKISRILSNIGNKGIRNLLRAIYVGLYDFWQLAFNVQLNPLAVTTPQYGRG